MLKRFGRLTEFRTNPQAFIAAPVKDISYALHDLVLEETKDEKSLFHEEVKEDDFATAADCILCGIIMR